MLSLHKMLVLAYMRVPALCSEPWRDNLSGRTEELEKSFETVLTQRNSWTSTCIIIRSVLNTTTY